MTRSRLILCLCALFLVHGRSSADIYLIPPPGVDLIGEETSTVSAYEDTMPDIARRYGLGYEEILSANPGADPWLPDLLICRKELADDVLTALWG